MKRGLIIAFTGTDGSGKSTVIEEITPWLEELNTEGVHYEHLRPNWLPPLGTIAGKPVKDTRSPVVDPHGQETSGFLGSLVRLCYYSLDYSVGYWLKTRKLSKKGAICLFDRYFYDILVDPRRMRIQLPEWILRKILGLYPEPDLIICLGGDPETLYARKPETSLQEVNRQVVKLNELVVEEMRASWVDTTQSLEGTIAEVREVIENHANGQKS
ncbi:MAG: hypothetical protein ABGY95_12270 [Rubritalea sp.]|uniref:hypothetical protein n=1 Tax=Rubritalea sp. TaxID=2109375 RepID=UPI0032421870